MNLPARFVHKLCHFKSSQDYEFSFAGGKKKEKLKKIRTLNFIRSIIFLGYKIFQFDFF